MLSRLFLQSSCGYSTTLRSSVGMKETFRGFSVLVRPLSLRESVYLEIPRIGYIIICQYTERGEAIVENVLRIGYFI